MDNSGTEASTNSEAGSYLEDHAMIKGESGLGALLMKMGDLQSASDRV